MQYSFWLATACLLPAVILTPASTYAHQAMQAGELQATVHFEPDDSPFAGQPSFTWVHLTQPTGEAIALSDCDCSLTVYDAQQQPIARPTLNESTVAGHGAPMSTSITFPVAGMYQVVIAGQSKSSAFEPFELMIPVSVRP